MVPALLGTAVCILPAGYMTCDQRPLAVFLLCLCLCFMALSRGGYAVNPIDLAPRHAGVLMGISNTVATIPGMTAPLVAGALTPNVRKRRGVASRVLRVRCHGKTGSRIVRDSGRRRVTDLGQTAHRDRRHCQGRQLSGERKDNSGITARKLVKWDRGGAGKDNMTRWGIRTSGREVQRARVGRELDERRQDLSDRKRELREGDPHMKRVPEGLLLCSSCAGPRWIKQT
ncbi:hypothetical protein BaRGS_00017861 [Batillaria attramentaria]|uniref:Uncharacterized protein n=1 Tax=Batillaria attramentaria TaxID=370345 RepID=A0ABD0KVT1_9CAEN